MTLLKLAVTFAIMLASLRVSKPQPFAMQAVPSPTALTFHVTRSEQISDTKVFQEQRLEGTLDGKRVILRSEGSVFIGGISGNGLVLPLGDYPAQLVEDKQADGGVFRRYLLTYPSGKQGKYLLVGFLE